MGDRATMTHALAIAALSLCVAGCEGSLAAAGNPATSPADLARLANDHDTEVQKAVAGNPSTPAPVLTTLYASPDWRPIIAANPGISAELMVKVFMENIDGGYYSAHDGGSSSAGPILAAIAQNPATPLSILYDLAEESDEVGSAALKNPKLMTPEAQAWLVETSLHLQTARDHGTSPAVLAALAADDSVEVRRLVAENPNSPPAALLRLAGDGRDRVLLAITRNPKVRPEVLGNILADLAGDESTAVREAVAKNHGTPARVLSFLAHDASLEVRSDVAANPSTSPATLTLLFGDKDESVIEKIGANSSAPPDLRAAAKAELVRFQAAPSSAGAGNDRAGAPPPAGPPAPSGSSAGEWKPPPPRTCHPRDTGRDRDTGQRTWVLECG
jgi:Leucine rich repeat variant